MHMSQIASLLAAVGSVSLCRAWAPIHHRGSAGVTIRDDIGLPRQGSAQLTCSLNGSKLRTISVAAMLVDDQGKTSRSTADRRPLRPNTNLLYDTDDNYRRQVTAGVVQSDRASHHRHRHYDRMLRLERQLSRVSKAGKSHLVSTLETATAYAPAVAKNTKRTSTGLTRDEEIQFSYAIRTFRAAVRLRDQLVRQDASTGMHIHPTEQEWADACGCTVRSLRRVMQEGQEARAALAAANIGLVTSIAKRNMYSLKRATEAGGGLGTILTLQDMIQEGNLGLMEAAEKYLPEKGFRFSTYATYWIRNRVLRAISDSSRIIRLPAHVHCMLQKISKARNEIKSELGRDPTAQELALHLELTEEKLQMYTHSSRNVVSLELPVRNTSFKHDDRRTLGDTLASDAPSPEDDAEADYLRRDIRAVMETALADKERDVIVNRFGLEDGKARSVQETADLLGISRDRVRLVEARALNKLRHPQRNYKLKEYLGQQLPSASSSDDREDLSEKWSLERIWF